MRSTISIAVLAIVLLSGAAAVSADIVTSSLTGRVTAGEQPAPSVRVTVTSAALLQPRFATTHSDGRYFIDALPPGHYDVTFERAGLQSLTRPTIVELGRVARADARLEASEDDESVTSTAVTPSVADTTVVTSHFSREDLDRLPLIGGPLSAIEFAPSPIGMFLLDETPLTTPIVGYDVIDEVSVLRAALPAELSSFAGGVIALRTRSGAEEFSLSVRDTWFDSNEASGHFYESESGGPIVPERLWFFAGGWSGHHALSDDADGFHLKLTAQPWAAHNFVASYLDGQAGGLDGSAAVVRYTGVAGERLVFEAVASRVESSSVFSEGTGDDATGRLSWQLGSHVLSGGLSYLSRESAFGDIEPTSSISETTAFLNDRWSWRNLTLNAGLRTADGEASPRVALTWDVRGNGRQAIAASYGEYSDPSVSPDLRQASIGFITAVGTGGTARIDAIRREFDGQSIDQLQFESRYRLFDRFEFGTAYSHDEIDSIDEGRDVGRVWAGAQIALFESHEFGVTFVERHDEEWGSDLALRYSLPIRRVVLTLGSDTFDLFDDARSLRLWARVRL